MNVDSDSMIVTKKPSVPIHTDRLVATVVGAILEMVDFHVFGRAMNPVPMDTVRVRLIMCANVTWAGLEMIVQ